MSAPPASARRVTARDRRRAAPIAMSPGRHVRAAKVVASFGSHHSLGGDAAGGRGARWPERVVSLGVPRWRGLIAVRDGACWCKLVS